MPQTSDSITDATMSAMPDGWSATAVAELIEMVNEWYDDVLALLACGLAGHTGAVRGRLTDVTPASLVVLTDGPDGQASSRIAFVDRLDTVAEFWEVVPGMIERARSAAPDLPLTSYERGGEAIKRVRTFLTTVAEVHDLHPHLREIVFAGGDLATFEPLGPDTFLYVLVPPRGRHELTIGRDFSWDAVGAMPENERPGGAYYTVRRWDPGTQRLTMHFVLHGDEGSGSAWARRAQPGDPVALWGPRVAFEPPAGTEWLLLVADETGLPATAAILERLEPGQRALVFAEVAAADEHQDLPTSDAIDVTWLHRDGRAPGTTTLLLDAVRALDWPHGRAYAWGGGESRALTAVRKYLRTEIGLTRNEVSMSGYWRRDAPA